jgi:amino acid permease
MIRNDSFSHLGASMTSGHSSARNAPAWASALLVLIGLILIVVAVVYFVEPADKLPAFFPGHSAHEARKHVKHAIAALVVALIAFAGAWFGTGRKRA